MNKILTALTLLMFLAILFINCQAQIDRSKTAVQPVNCNRTVYGTSKYISSLPTYICIPDDFVIDDFARKSDLNGDGFEDFIALKYNKKEDDQVNGDTTYWNFYARNKQDTIYELVQTLSNLVPPFIENISLDYLGQHPFAEKLYYEYPRRLSHALSFQLKKDTIRLSYKFDDSYGKTFVFVHQENNWYLENLEYFFGELPMYWWRDTEFYYPLTDKLKIIETRKPLKRISIDQLDLKEAFKYRETEWMHISEWHVDRIDETRWRTVDQVKFEKCHGLELPEDWIY